MTDDYIFLMLALIAGLLAGGFFFGGLWWTVKKLITAKHPALLTLGSLLVRTTVVMLVFYFVADGQISRILLSLMGFILARNIVKQLVEKRNDVSVP